MRSLSMHRFLFALLLSSFLTAGAQREAVKTTAGDASAAKADPPAHADAKGTGNGKGKASVNATTETADAGNGDGGKGDDKGPSGRGGRRGAGGPGGADDKEQSAYDFGLPTVDGKNQALSDFKGKVLLIVNLGRQSSYASQLTALEKLNDTFKDKGLVVIGVPSDDFGNAEPGTPAEIAKFYTDAKVNFPVMAESSLTGVHELPLFTYLAKNKAITDDGLHWNFTKFIVDRKGKVIVRFPPEVAPDSLELTATLEEVLDGTWKPKKPAGGRGGRPGGGEDDGGPE